jgi:hypothetical protein
LFHRKKKKEKREGWKAKDWGPIMRTNEAKDVLNNSQKPINVQLNTLGGGKKNVSN